MIRTMSCICTLTMALAVGASAQTFVNRTPVSGPAPAARAWASAVLDSQSDRVIYYAGRAASDFGDIWAFDLATHMWTDLTPGVGSTPAARRTPGSVYDPANHRMVMWSGQAPGLFFNDVWAFDLTGNTWSQFTPAGGPPNIRYGVALTWDPLAGDLVTFAGFTNMGRFDDVWRFNGAADTWTDVSPGSGPLERCLHAACYDAVGHRLIMYGGQNAGALDDIWAFDLTAHTWTDITPVVKPAGRWFTSLACDDTNRRVTIFGGFTAGGRTNDAWVFDLWTGQWTQLFPAGTAPSARDGAPAVWDGANDRMLIFQGETDSGVINEVWAIENLSGTPTPAPHPAPVAADVTLHPNVPNPFNPSTTIRFELLRDSHVRLDVYDANGRRVRGLVNAARSTGVHDEIWDGRDGSGRAVASGVYFVRLDTGAAVVTRKAVLAK